MSLLILLTLIVCLLIASAFFSGSETGLYSLSRVKLRYRADQGDRRARCLSALTNPPTHGERSWRANVLMFIRAVCHVERLAIRAQCSALKSSEVSI